VSTSTTPASLRRSPSHRASTRKSAFDAIVLTFR
jgi:hypothetical protein